MSMALTLTWAPLAGAVTIGEAVDGFAGQAPLLTVEGYDRFDTGLVDVDLLAALGTAAPLDGALLATGSSITVGYVGTAAAREATLFVAAADAPGSHAVSTALASTPSAANTLFDTREGLSYAAALADPFGVITSIGFTRTLSALQVGDVVVLGLAAAAQPLGPDAQLRPDAQTFYAGAGASVTAHWLTLPDGRLLLGFEEGADASFNDVVVVLQGVAPAAAVPEVPSAALLLFGLAAVLVRRHHRGN